LNAAVEELLNAIATLSSSGWLGITVFMAYGFISGIVLTRGHHREVIEGYKERISEYENLTKELRSENVQLRQALAIAQSQAARATAVTATVVEQARGGA
jgi:hypothetical protein